MRKYVSKQNIIFIIMFGLLFMLALYMDKYTRGLVDIDLYGFNTFGFRSLWFSFSLSWIFIVLLIVMLFPRKRRVLIFNIINSVWLITFVSQICFVQSLGKFMIISDLFSAGEGLQYANNAFTNLNVGMVVVTILSLIGMILLVFIDKKMNDKKDINKKHRRIIFFVLIGLILLFRGIGFINLGTESTESWEENYNVKNIYNNFNNSNNAMYVSGFYEYHFRSFYKYFYNLLTFDQNVTKANIDKYNETYGVNYQPNDYTGKFKDKNVVYVMMESIDSWIIDEETMPTLYKIMNEGINFTNRYAPSFDGGQTINTEFALNTGLYSISKKKTIYDISDMEYNYSLASILSKNGYQANSLHGNTGSFYNRTMFHQQLGYKMHYSAADLQDAQELPAENNYYSDSVLLSDDKLLDLVTSEDKFMLFITTYSAHLEYEESNRVYKTITPVLDNTKYESEEYIYRSLARDTDDGIKNLLTNFEKRNILNDTVFIFVSDHFVYGYSDPDYVAIKKNCNNNRRELQNVPLVIWTPGIEHEEVDIILDTADILPTVLNMLDIKYDPNKYIGTDVFSKYHDNFVWFDDGNYIDGKNNNMTRQAILTKVNANISKNKSILLTNYYGN